VLVCVFLSSASAVFGQDPAASSQQDSLLLEGVVLEGDSPADSATVVLHRVFPDDDSLEASGEVLSTEVGPGGEFQFVLPAEPDGDFQGLVYFASVEYQGVLYFGSAIAAVEQLDTLYVVQTYPAEEVPLEGVSLSVEERIMFMEFIGEEWVATDLFLIDNRDTRTLVAQEGGVVWSYPLPLGASQLEVGDSNLPPDAITFDAGRVRVRAPLPPGDRSFIIRYRLEDLASTIPAPGSTEGFQLLIREPAPLLEVEGLEPLGVENYQGANYRSFGGAGLIDAAITLVETEPQSEPQLQWLALIATMVLVLGGVWAYARPRRRVAGVTGRSLGREELILEVARIDDTLAGASEPEIPSELLERRAALLALIRTAD
jgi:hypothetical protein